VSTSHKAPIRLALRSEGDWINAYIALTDTMEGALPLGSLHRTLAADAGLWGAWKALMTEATVHMLETVIGVTPDKMIEQPAPESERSGNA
jgi:hypothetical protein